MTTLAVPMTNEEFRQLPEPEDGATLELIGRLTRRLGAFADQHGLGEVVSGANFEFSLERDWSPVPDVAFISTECFAQIFQDSRPYSGSPDLAVEVTSPSNSHREIASKTEAYIRSGAKRVWVVDPGALAITVTRPDWTSRTYHAGDAVTSDDAAFAVDGFALDPATLFAREG